MKEIANINSFMVKQQKRFGTVADRFGQGFTNQYAIYSPEGAELFVAAEHVGDMSQEAIRMLYKKDRPFEIEVHDDTDNLVLKVIRKKPGKSSQAVDIFDPQKNKIALLRRNPKLLERNYTLTAKDFSGDLTIKGSLLDSNRFEITQGTKRIGEIKKVKEPFFKKGNSCDDQFVVSFAQSLDSRLKLIFLGSVFLIDFVYFE